MGARFPIIHNVMKPQRWTRREHERYETFECTLVQRVRTSSTCRGMIVDVSLGGLQLRSREAFDNGEVVRVRIGRDKGASLTLRGEIRYSKYMSDSGLYATGIRFAPESHEERLALASYLNAVVISKSNLAND